MTSLQTRDDVINAVITTVQQHVVCKRVIKQKVSRSPPLLGLMKGDRLELFIMGGFGVITQSSSSTLKPDGSVKHGDGYVGLLRSDSDLQP